MLAVVPLTLVVIGFLIAFVLAFGIGANDVANSFGTSVGSKVLSLRAACILATICEVSGSVLLGGHVSKTLKEGIIEPSLFNGTENAELKLMYGQVSSLIGACVWMIVATFFKIPVSGSQSIVGAYTGFGLVLFGIKGIQWKTIGKIVASWFISPALSGFISTVLFLIIKYSVLVKEKSLEPALYTLPFLYAVTIIINVFSVLYGGLTIIKLPKLDLWIVLTVSFGLGIIVGLFVFFVVRPILRKRVLNRLEAIATGEANNETKQKWHARLRCRISKVFNRSKRTDEEVDQLGSETDVHGDDADEDLKLKALQSADDSRDLATVEDGEVTTPEDSSADTPVEFHDPNNRLVARGQIFDRPEEGQVFAFAQILTATFGSFVHGGNDVSNAIGPLIGLWIVSTTGDVAMKAPTPIWLLVYGGVGISVGLCIWGRKVMETVGDNLTVITPSSGMCIELGAAVTVLIASKVGIPVSTTHCLVGSVITVGFIRSRASVNWKLFGNIFMAWMVTLPVSIGISALTMYSFLQLT